jgi:mono/diheme cytochrome c family protein
MKRNLSYLAILIGTIAVTGHPIAAMAAMTFTTVKTEFPDSSERFPAGPHADAINNNCLGCHSADMVLDQPPMPRAKWQAVVDKMRSSYKAPVSDADANAVVDYLASVKGAK